MKEKIVAKCVEMTIDGTGIVFIDDKKVFVPNLLVGEEAEIHLTKKGKGYYLGKSVRRIISSPIRMMPRCNLFHLCGGCDYQHIKYEEQLNIKEKYVQNLFQDSELTGFEFLPILGMRNPFRYRDKIQLPISLGNDSSIISGYYKVNSHDIVNNKRCFLHDEKCDYLVECVKNAMINHSIPPYIESTNSGIIKHIMIRRSEKNRQTMLVLVTSIKEFDYKQAFVDAIIDACPFVTTIVQNIHPQVSNVILGEEEVVLYGRGFIEETVMGKIFKVSPRSFFQVNNVQVEVLYSRALALAALQGNEVVLDAYCGVGAIGILAASKAKSVVGVDIVESAIENAKENASVNDVQNISFYASDVSEYMKENKNQFDVVFIDPPRKGCSNEFLEALKGMSAEKIIYISCNPQTLVRDLQVLGEKYEIKIVQCVDVFPMTKHVETIVLLQKIFGK